MSNEDFYQLVIRSQSGDKNALNTIIQRFYPLIYKTILTCRSEDRSDLEQEIIEKIICAVISYEISDVETKTVQPIKDIQQM